MLRPNSPIVNAGLLYVNGLALDALVIPSVPVSSYVSGKAFIVEPGQARDSTNTNDIFLNQPFVDGVPYVLNNLPVGAVLNALQVGANGLDVGVLAASSLYNVYVIGSSLNVDSSLFAVGGGPLNFLPPNAPFDSVPAIPSAFPVNSVPGAVLLSLASNPVPFLPLGYDMYRLIGTAVTDVSADIAWLTYLGNGQSDIPQEYAFPPVSVLVAGAATTFTAVSLASAIPSGVASQVKLAVSYTSSLAGHIAQFLPYGSALTVGVVQFGGGPAGVQTGVVTVPVGSNAGVPTILYNVQAGDTLSLSVIGYY